MADGLTGTTRRRLGGPARALLAVSVGLVAVTGLALGALALRLASGPIDLSTFASAVRDAVATTLPPDHTVDLGRFNLEWTDSGLSVRVHDFAVRDAQGRNVVTAAVADVGINPLSLFVGAVQPRSIVVREPLIGLVMRVDGTITPGEVPRAREESGPVSLLEMLPAPPGGGAPALPRTIPLARGSLERLVLDDVRLAVFDERTNRRRVAQPFDVTFRRSGGAYDLTLSGGAEARWSISAHLVEGPAGRTARVSIAGFDAARLSTDPGPPLPVDMTFAASVDAEGVLGRVEGVATVGGFSIDIDGEPALIEPGRFDIAFDAAERRFWLGPAMLRSGAAGARVRVEGRLPAPGDPTGAVRLTLTGDDVALAGGRLDPRIARISATATYEARDRRLWIDRFVIGPVEGSAVIEGQLGLGLFGRSPEVRLAARAGGLDAALVKASWPPSLNRDLRRWVMDNVVEGRLDAAEVEMTIPNDWMAERRPLRDDMFRGRYVVSGAVVRATAELPPVEGLSGTILATGNTSRVEARVGTMTFGAGVLALSAGTYVCDDVQAPRATCLLTATATGPVGAHLEAGDRQSGGIIRAGGFDTRTLTGEGSAQLRVTIPIGQQNRTAVPAYQIDAEFRQIAGRAVVEGYDVDRGAIRLRADNRGFETQGTMMLAGVPVRLSGRAETGRRTVLRAEVDTTDDIRSRFGLDLGDWMSGPAQLRFIKEIGAAPPYEAIRRIEADLVQARLNLVPLAFEKPRGQPATLAFTLRQTARTTVLDDATLTGRGFQMRGRVTLDGDGVPSLIDLTEVRLRPEDAFAARWERDGARQTVRVTGRSVDARPFLSRIFSDVDVTAPAVEGDQRARLDLSIRVDRLLGANGVAIGEARLEMTRQGQQITALNLGGSLGGAARLTGQTLSDRGRPYLMISATDGGALLRFADLYRNMSGGRLTLTQTLTDPTARSADGVLFVQDFRIVNDPTFERLFGAASAIETDGTVRPAARGPESAEIDRLRVVFTRADGITQIREGSMRNPLLGLTFDGRVDFRRDRLELKGIAIPMFALNNLLARVPILGAFLGGQDGGLWGVTYQVTGPVAQPQLAINPVSAIAPGFLRNMFRFPDPPGQEQR